jgi:hypothetical protein
MVEGGRTHKPTEAGPDAAKDDASRGVPAAVERDELFGQSRMNPVVRGREQAAAGISRSLKAWRKAGGSARGGAAIPNGAGAPLDGATRARMEPHLGARLDGVRVHTGADSAVAADGLGARAFTVGDDVHFGAGQFAPGSREGDRLLAHELTHAVQAQRSGIQRKAADGGDDSGDLEVSQPHEGPEKEADAMGDHVANAEHDGDGSQPPAAAAPLDGARVFRMHKEEGSDLTCNVDKDKEEKNAAAREKLTHFMGSTFAQKNYVTANGYGAFDLAYDPKAGTVTVTIKLEFQFEDAPPSVYMKYLPMMPTCDLTKLPDCFWTDDKKEKFKNEMVANVDRVWSKQHKFKCTHSDSDLTDEKSPQWKDVAADASVVVKPVDAGGHFKVKVTALPKADYLRAFVSGKDHHKDPAQKGKAGEVADKDFQATTAEFSSSKNEQKTNPSSLGGKSTKQATTAHETGHMLGQDDQYSTDSLKPGDTNDSGSKVSKVPADEERIMDGGEKVLEEHYSTILDALNAATKPVTFGF